MIPKSLSLSFASVTNYQVASLFVDKLSISNLSVVLVSDQPLTLVVSNYTKTNNTCYKTLSSIICTGYTPIITTPVCDIDIKVEYLIDDIL